MSGPDDLRSIDALLEIMARLRHPETGCPWDLEQDFGTIAPYTIEEAYEVKDAIDRADMPGLKDELGDLLLQVVFHARMAEEAGQFSFADVVEAISEKMVRRHPHVFGDGDADTPDAVRGTWEEIKAAERAEKGAAETPPSALDGVARALPALLRAEKLQKRAARVGFDWPAPGPVFDKVREEMAELEEAAAGPDGAALREEAGDLLFSVANLARHFGLDPEATLSQANDKFERRFKAMEARVETTGEDLKALDLDRMEAHWQAAKADD
jgi:MazG family protein